MSDSANHILVVDDDAALCDMLATYLGDQGFTVRTAGSGGEMDKALAAASPDLILLDIMLPGEDGLSLTRRLRAHGNIPIIMLSARGEDVDRIVGLELGADDYVAKPFNPRELLARLRAVLRRRAASAPGAPTAAVAFGPFRLDLASHSLTRDGELVALTTAEFTLLSVLARHPGRVLSRDQLVSLAQDAERIPFDRSIDVRVARLRRKIEPDPDNPRYIRTVWGAGYLFSPGAAGGEP
jgi:two-component system phosphate regulon response regulator OmpR